MPLCLGRELGLDTCFQLREAVLPPGPCSCPANRSMTLQTFGSVTVSLVNDNIAARGADVLVNAANNQLHMGGGVAAALRSRGGIEIHQEAVRHAPARIGSVIRTGAGKLPATYVYHAVVIDYSVSKGTSLADVAEVTRNLIGLAITDGVRTMALPLFGAGVGGLSIESSLTTILDGLETAAAEIDAPLHIEIAVWDKQDFKRAEEVFEGYSSQATRQ